MQQFFKWMFCVFMCFSLMACSSPNSPKGVAKSFWDGVMSQNAEKTRQYTSSTTRDTVDFSKNKIDWENMKLTLGSTDMVGQEAMVHTVIINQETGAKYAFNTYLVQENGQWRVDFVRTRKASITSEIFADIITSLDKFNKALNSNFDETIAGFREASPEIKLELDKLTDTLAKHMQESSQAGNQNVHSKIEDFKTSVMDIFVHHPAHEVPAEPATPTTTTSEPAKISP
jgi:hypothetical protein